MRNCECNASCGDDPQLENGNARHCSDYQKQQLLTDIVQLNFGQNMKDSYVVQVAYALVAAHAEFEMMLPAVEKVRKNFPLMDSSQLILMWIAINAKEREFIS
jgi:hypothetical protein